MFATDKVSIAPISDFNGDLMAAGCRAARTHVRPRKIFLSVAATIYVCVSDPNVKQIGRSAFRALRRTAFYECHPENA